LWAHARAAGMLGAVFTIFELHSGDVAIGTPFENMDPYVRQIAAITFLGELFSHVHYTSLFLSNRIFFDCPICPILEVL